jgi:pyruvate decarboxylase
MAGDLRSQDIKNPIDIAEVGTSSREALEASKLIIFL